MKIWKYRKTLIFLIVLAIIIISAALIIPRLFDLYNYNGLIASKIEDSVQGEVHIGNITWGISDGIWFRTDAFSIANASSLPVDLDLANIYVKLAVLPILSKKVEIEEITLGVLNATLKLESKTDEGDSVAFNPDSFGTLLPVEISVEKLLIQDGQLRIEDDLTVPGQRNIYVFNKMTIEATNIIPGSIADFQLSLKGDKGTGLEVLQAKGSFKGLVKTYIVEDPEIKFNAIISSLDTKILKPYLKDSPVDNSLEGLVSLELNYEGDLLSHFDIAGSADLSEITYGDPDLWDNIVKGSGTLIDYKTTFDPNSVKVHDLKIRIGKNTVNAHASIENWKEKPVVRDISVSSNLFPEELVYLVPWKILDKYSEKIRPIMEGGGHLGIESLKIDEINLSEPFPEFADILYRADLDAKVSNISIPSISDMPEIDLVSCNLQLTDGIVNFQDLKISAISTNLPTISGKIEDLLDDPVIQVRVLGELKIPDRLGTQGTKALKKIGIEKMTGTSDLDLNMTMRMSKLSDLRLNGSAVLKDFHFKTFYSHASLEKLHTSVNITPKTIQISDLSTVCIIPETDSTKSGRFFIRMNGRLDDWNKEPVALLQYLSTSPISLNPIASLMPWDQLGQKADFVKEVLLAGGTLEIKNLSLPGINLKKTPKDFKRIIAGTKAVITLADIKMQPHPALPAFDDIGGNASIDKGVLRISDTHGRMGAVTIPSISLRATRLDNYPKVTASFKGPITVSDIDSMAIENFWKEKGFRDLTGETLIDVKFEYDHQYPEKWVAKGSLVFGGINVKSYPEGVHLDNLQGKVLFSRGKTIELIVNDISAKINKATIDLDGKLTGGGTPDMLLDGRAYVKELDLREFQSLLPHLDYLKLAGELDLNLNFKIPYSHPADTRLEGVLNASNIGFHLPDYNIAVKDTTMAAGFEGDTVQLTNMDMNINDQFFHIEGSMSDPVAPKISINVQSPDMDVDRLIPKTKKDKADQSQKEDTDDSDIIPGEKKKDSGRELPSWTLNLISKLQVNINKGNYKNQSFNDLNIKVVYKDGVVQDYRANCIFSNGEIASTGSVDLRDPERIRFIMNPDIRNIQIGDLSTLFKVEKMPLNGPLSINGRMEGAAGNVQELLSSLKGTLRVDVGQGRIPEVQYIGKLATKILTFINLKGLFSGSLTNQIENEGIPFNAIKSEATFSKGNMDINNFIFLSDSLNGISQGAVNFPEHKIAMQIILQPLQSIDKILGIVPLLGKQAQKLTNVYLVVDGPLDNPSVRTIPGKGIKDALIGTLSIPGALFRDTEELLKEINEQSKKERGKQ